MRIAIPALVMVSLFALACGGSSPAPASAPAVQSPPVGAVDSASPAPVVAQATPYQTDLEAWCNAPSRAPGAAAATKETRPRLMAEWISAQLKSDQAKALAQRMGTTAPAERHAVFRKELDGQGIHACPFLDEMP